MFRKLVKLIPLVFCVAGIYLICGDALFLYMSWYSGVEMEWANSDTNISPWTMIYVRLGVVIAAVSLVLPGAISALIQST